MIVSSWNIIQSFSLPVSVETSDFRWNSPLSAIVTAFLKFQTCLIIALGLELNSLLERQKSDRQQNG